MAITLSNVNIGSGPGAGNGDPLRTAFNTINNNFALVQANLNNPSGATSVSALANNGFQLQLDSTGNTLVPKNLTVAGNLIVIGNVTVVNQEIINSSEIVAGNLTANLNVFVTSNIYGNIITTIAGSSANLTLDPDGTADVVLTPNTSLWLLDTSPSINTTSGALIVYGGTGVGGNLYVGAGIFSPTITAINANVTAANIGMIGYVGQQVTTANIGMIGYINQQVTAANVAWSANASNQQSQINNLQASAYSNVNLTAYLAGNITAGNIVSTSANIAGIVLTNNNIYSWQLATDIQFGQLAATANIVMNRNVVHNRDVNVIGNITANNITLSGNVTGNVNGYAIGYRDIPQVTSANVTFALTDGGKHYYSTTAVNTLTVPNNTNVAFPTGTAISIINGISANIAIALQANVTMYLATNNVSSSRTITGYGMATLIKVNTNTWYINGSGVV
jgi:hypothetical protein